MKAAREIMADVGVSKACRALEIPRSRFYRFIASTSKACDIKRPAGLSACGSPAQAEAGADRCNAQTNMQGQQKHRGTPLALSEEEILEVVNILNSPQYMDQTPREVYFSLLDKGVYLCSVRSMYRILGKHKQVKERRDLIRHPVYKKPELLAQGPNEVWSWDITKLRGPVPYCYYQLYVILDIFSRYVAGWMLAHRESAELAKELIEQTCIKQGIEKGQLTIHADRGSPMKALTVAKLMDLLGVIRSHSRPHVSNDNPYSESQFKTMKYRPQFPDRFGSFEEANSFCETFFPWYNQDHYHSGIAYLTPEDVHYGRSQTVIRGRQKTLDAFFALHPDRFRGVHPHAPSLPPAVWINPPHPIHLGKAPGAPSPAESGRTPLLSGERGPLSPISEPSGPDVAITLMEELLH